MWDSVVDALESRWRASHWGYKEVAATPLQPDDGVRWCRYMLKEFDGNKTERWFANF